MPSARKPARSSACQCQCMTRVADARCVPAVIAKQKTMHAVFFLMTSLVTARQKRSCRMVWYECWYEAIFTSKGPVSWRLRTMMRIIFAFAFIVVAWMISVAFLRDLRRLVCSRHGSHISFLVMVPSQAYPLFLTIIALYEFLFIHV